MALNEELNFLISHQQRQVLNSASVGSQLPYYRAVIQLDSSLEPQQQKAKFESLVNRHEIFRTRFVQELGMKEPVQQISEEATDMRWAVSQEEPDTIDGNVSLSLDNLIEATLYVSDSGLQTLHLNISSLVCDHHSLEQICFELAQSDETDESVQYVDFSQWQDDVVQEDEPARAFWQKNANKQLPFAKLPGESNTKGYEQRSSSEFALSNTAPGQADSSWLLSLWMTILARFSGAEQLAVLVHFDGRISEDFTLGIGPYSRMLPLVMAVKSEMTGEQLQGQIKRNIGQLNSNQMSMPVIPNTELAGSIGFECLQNTVFSDKFSGEVCLLSSSLVNDQCVLKLSCRFADGNLQARILYNATRYSQEFIDVLRKSLVALQANWDTSKSLDAQHLVTTTDDAAHLRRATEYNHELKVVDMIQQTAAIYPQNIAVESYDDNLTYQELNQKANQLSHQLLAGGIGVQKLVGICFERSFELSIAMLAVLKTGAAFIAIDPKTPPQRATVILENADIVLTDKKSGSYDALKVWQGTTICVDKDGSEQLQLSTENPEVAIHSSSPAYILYTSGSTGKPKGVVISNAALSNYIQHSTHTYLTNSSGAVVHTSIGFDLTITGLLAPLTIGKKVVMVADAVGVDALQATLAKQSEKVMLKLTPSHLKVLATWLENTTAEDFPIDTLVVGGEALYKSDIAMLQRDFPSLNIFNEYGPTEATVGCCLYKCRSEQPAAQMIPIGHPISGTELYVLDNNMKILPRYCTGELYIGGLGLAEGYLKQPQLTASRFIELALPDGTHKRLYKTGDLVRLEADGFVYLGRNDSQVKIRGHRVEVGEVEAVLKKALPVDDVVVKAGHNQFDEVELIAYVKTTQHLTLEDLHKTVSDTLPAYMLPAHIICLEEFPLTQNGKVDMIILPDVADLINSKVEYVAPRNDVEKSFSDAFRAVLKLENVGIKDNFFVMGGDSIRAVQLVSSINESGYELSVEDLFNLPNIEALAQFALENKVQVNSEDACTVEALLNELNDLSEEEVALKLAELEEEL
ncbi:amino acid adenylation domain-containing protein [Rheinheimera pacifica]|uniref:Amino acid adenylation domain-containing protein n=1 Tax=Rheinheimera pacifica TaxID=173990 RepID=A0A1H6MU64_9GAMM|nr:amino acid adenylation domain-containing protein [Rheinheimera pacifica]SEI05587.1 amino acid adenylation domain-containing protein [Rheinheimera pacifica]